MAALGARVCSKGAGAGQWAAVLLVLIGPAGCSKGAKAPAPVAETGPNHPGPSGLPVPRYVSLKFDKVNARAGPGDDYPLKWVYKVKGLPLQVVAETDEWRRVCDSEGGLSWVHRRTTDARRTVIRTQAQDLVLRAKPDDSAAGAAVLVAHAMADLQDCKGDWCRVSAGHAKGWIHADAVWGTDPKAQCG